MEWNLEEAMGYYQKQGAPGDQSALIGLLKEIQAHKGGVSRAALAQIAGRYAIGQGILLALIKRIPSLRLAEIHTLELCAGPNCGKSRDLAEAAENLHRENPDRFTLQYVPCMRMCGKGPNIRWDGEIHHRATKELLRQLTEK